MLFMKDQGVKVVPAGISLEGLRGIKMDRLENAWKFSESADILLIDAPAGLEKDALAAIAAAQEMILVTTQRSHPSVTH